MLLKNIISIKTFVRVPFFAGGLLNQMRSAGACNGLQSEASEISASVRAFNSSVVIDSSSSIAINP